VPFRTLANIDVIGPDKVPANKCRAGALTLRLRKPASQRGVGFHELRRGIWAWVLGASALVHVANVLRFSSDDRGGERGLLEACVSLHQLVGLVRRSPD
jgi:hypothetical protein